MSDQIKKLKELCRTDKHWDADKQKWIEASFDEDKFARLIINESVKAIDIEVNNWTQLAPFNQIIKHRGIQAIRTHFGI